MPVDRAGRNWYLVDALGLTALVAMYMWKWQAASPRSWWILATWMGLSVLVRRDTPKTLGWRADNLWPATRRALPFFSIASLAICGAGLFLGMLQRLPAHLIEPRRFTGYLAFCLLQQVALNSFLTNRLLSYFGEAWPAAVLAGALFAALHWPNPVLVPLTLVGGVAMTWLFARERNILPLALGQAILGALVWWAFPLAWHHSMRVGPGFWAFHM
jgi:Type II CAAX prenyl endopeptidase Rce1-like